MAVTLRVNGFSCISDALLEVAPLTVIIGPQASGKSVISKLVFFFTNLWVDQLTAIEDGDSIEQFRSAIKDKFCALFPPSAWGKGKFSVEFAAGVWSVRITRSVRKTGGTDLVRVTLSEFFESHYKRLEAQLATLRKKMPGHLTDSYMEFSWELRQSSEKLMAQKLKADFHQFQLFIPAGRSFFTNAGKAVTLLEQGNMVDPLIARFGRIFANARDRMMIQRRPRSSEKALDKFSELSAEIIGGAFKRERAQEYLESKDGRKIPFVALSSGQQELLPLFLALKFWDPFDKRRNGSIIYIEEPEAHLFPTAQSKLVEILALAVNAGMGNGNKMVLTTHSPYVLAKLNNLILAGMVSKQHKINLDQLGRAVPAFAWLDPSYVAAYAIEDGRLIDIKDSSGLINGQYLDGVSGAIAEEFNTVLSLQFDLGVAS